MKFYTAIQEVNLDNAIIEKARQFARQVISTVNYKDSNQISTNKIQQDHFISKLGEEAAKVVLSAYTLVNGPDYAIYQAKQKSWQHDLMAGNTGVAVKTQARSAAAKYSLSWTFQCGEKRKDIILQQPDTWIVFVECNDLANYRCNVYPPFQIKELVFKEPRLARLKNHKRVVYADTLVF